MTLQNILITACILFISLPKLLAQNTGSDKESEFYKITTIPIPEDIVLEVGGMAFMTNDRLAVTTRRGEVWLIDDPYMKRTKQPKFTRFAAGLHEPLGLAYRNGALYTTQRAELTKITDTNKDDKGDKFETIYSWPLSGNYHEYSYGPLFLPNGDMLVTLNLAWIGYGASLSKWRGWMLKITEDGKMTPIATGLRSPAGFGFDSEGEVFYAENQGDWIGSGRITHLEEGDFAGNPAGLKWADDPLSPLDLKPNQIPDSVGLMHEFAKEVPSLKVPTVWFPHTIMGISTSAILTDTTGGKFGPFEGQMLVGDQGHSKIMRVALEKVNGEYQGACFPFKEGFSSGILRFAWGKDGSLFVGMTSRGWASTGKEMYGLQKLSWTGKVPFEIKTMKAMSDGFELEFTEPVQKSVAENVNSYSMTSFNYSYHRSYGSPIIQQQDCPILAAMVSEDGKKVRLHIDGLRAGYIHEIKANGVRSSKGNALLHPVGYYTLNTIPEGDGSEPMIAGNTDAKEKDNSVSCGWDASKRITEMPADWNGEADMVINIGTKPGLKFSITDFEVPAGAKVQLTFTNNDDMLHNLVITEPGTIEEVSQASMQMGLEGPQKGYIPNSDNIMYHTCILQPETSESIYFVAPEKEDEYTYVCTFPGHAQVMRGVMKVTSRNTASR